MNRFINRDEQIVIAKIRLRRTCLIALPLTVGDEGIVGAKLESAGKKRFCVIVGWAFGTHDFIARLEIAGECGCLVPSASAVNARSGAVRLFQRAHIISGSTRGRIRLLVWRNTILHHRIRGGGWHLTQRDESRDSAGYARSRSAYE